MMNPDQQPHRPAINVRAATPDDGAAIAAIYAPYVLHTPFTFDETPPSPGEMAERIQQTLRGYPFLVAEVDGAVVGYAYAGPRGTRASFRWSVDTAIYVACDRGRGGIGTALYAKLLPALRRQGFIKAYAVITLPNVPSTSLHERLGFRHVATLPAVGFKLGAWRDVGWWELLLVGALPVPPAEPGALAER